MLTKLITLVSVFDDFYDNYSTTEESKMFTTALESWDERAAEQGPAYMKPFYKNVITSINDIEEDLKLQKKKHAVGEKLIIDMANCFHVKSKWCDQSYVPCNIEEHLRVSMGSNFQRILVEDFAGQ